MTISDEMHREKIALLNFWGRFQQRFMSSRSQKRKKDSLSVFFMLLGSERVKAALKMLMKLTPG
jgi:hypothetical protein